MDTGISVSSITRKTKLNSVAEMLNPAMLALNPEKYAAKMEAINTVYQNVKESYEKMQQKLELEQQELERQLFEAEASWSEKLGKKADEFLEEACDYLKRSAECFFLGNFTEEVTLLGVGCQIAVGFTGVDFPLDVRDIIADVKNIGEAEKVQWEQVAVFLLDVCALLPVIGCLKYADEAAVLVKHADEAADLVKHADKLKYVDEAGELLTEGRKLADSGIKELEDAVAEAQKLEKELAGSKLLDDVVGGGRDAIKSGKYSILSYEDAENIAFDAIHGPNNADAVVLGKYGDGGPTAYTSVAKDMDAQYFQLDNWDELAARYSDDEIWKINEKFLDIQTSSGREIYLSHNPEDYLGKEQFYSRELQYLLDNGYKFVDEGGIWYAVR